MSRGSTKDLKQTCQSNLHHAITKYGWHCSLINSLYQAVRRIELPPFLQPSRPQPKLPLRKLAALSLRVLSKIEMQLAKLKQKDGCQLRYHHHPQQQQQQQQQQQHHNKHTGCRTCFLCNFF